MMITNINILKNNESFNLIKPKDFLDLLDIMMKNYGISFKEKFLLKIIMKLDVLHGVC